MVNEETPAVLDRFAVDLGGKEIEHFFKVELPDLSIPVIEHNTGDSGKRYPTKHAEFPDYGGTFSASLYARGTVNAIDSWWKELTSWNTGTNQQSISFTAKAPDDTVIGRWEFEDAKLIEYNYDTDLANGDSIKVTITLSYRKMKRAKP